jgi:pSer/pThr/pTyr-binding forkhead associated (FHA) protein
MYVLVVQTGKYKGKRIKVAGPEVLVGRDETAGVRIGSEDVSRQHCLLTPTADGVLVRDLDSRNGTFIDSVPIGHNEDVLMRPGSALTVGPMTFQLSVLGAKRSPAPRKEPDAGSLSDDDISALLTEGDTSEHLSASDTTIITGRASVAAETSPPIPPAVKKKEFKSVADEAADIIRRYKEMLAAQQGAGEAEPDA